MHRLLLATLAAAPLFAAITFDNQAAVPVTGGFPATVSFTLTVGCANALVIVDVTQIYGSAPTVTVNSSSAAAVSLSPYPNPASTGQIINAFVITGVASGAASVVVTNTGGSALYMGALAGSYCNAQGVDVTQVGNTVGPTPPLTIGATTTFNHDWGLLVLAGGNTISAGTGTTQRTYNFGAALAMFLGDSAGDFSPPGSYALTANITGASVPFGFFIAIAPVVSSPAVTSGTSGSITNASAIISGNNVTGDGGGTITSRGVCYATTSNPTTPCTSNGTGTGVYLSTITGLSASTGYHYRAFATNSFGTSYGADMTFSTNATAYPTNVRISQLTSTQAILAFTAPNANVCSLQVSESATYAPLVTDVDPGIFSGADQDNRALNVNLGSSRQFVIGKRYMQLGNVGANTGRYFSRALEAATPHYYSLNCPGGVVTGTFTTKPPAAGSTFAEPFQGDLSNAGNAPYPYLDPTTRNSFYVDPQTGLRHTALTFPSDNWVNYLNQAYTDAQDVNGATWTNPTNVYMSSMPTTATTGTGNLWIGVRNTTTAASYDFITGPSYDYSTEPGANGSITFWQPTITASVGSGTDVLVWCFTVDRTACATTQQTLNITSTPTAYTLGPFYSTPNGAAGGIGADPNLFNSSPTVNRWHAYTHTGSVTSDGAGNIAWTGGNYFIDSWSSSSTSIIRLSTISTSDACTNGTAYNVNVYKSGIALSVSGTAPASGTFYYCASNFGLLIHRQTPDSRTVTLENASFNITTSPGPIWFSAAVIWNPSNVKLNGGYYEVVPPS